MSGMMKSFLFSRMLMVLHKTLFPIKTLRSIKSFPLGKKNQ